MQHYDISTKQLKCKVIKNFSKNCIHFVSDREFKKGEENVVFTSIKNSEDRWRIEASSDRENYLLLPGIPEHFVKHYLYIPIEYITLEMTTYLTTLCHPEWYELEEYVESGKIFLGVKTLDGKSNGNFCSSTIQILI